jgi:radical SAM superfamily enzyme YgiQ (UPF0313 family)
MANIILWNSTDIVRNNNLGSPGGRSLGAYQLASWLRHNGYTVKVIDFCSFISVDDLVKITEKNISSDTLTIGVSTTFWRSEEWDPSGSCTYIEPKWVISARKIIENKFSTIKWSMGGARTYLYQQENWIKFYNHAEDDYLKWLDELSNQKFKFRKNFDISTSFNHFQENDFIESHEVLPIELGRGCMFKCKFCAYDNIGKRPGTYSRSYNCVKEEILDHYNKWGTTRFYYIDDTVNESIEKVQALADIAQSLPFKLEWIGYIRADLMWSKPETEKLLIDSGLKSAFFGIESFENNSSRLVGKGWSGKHGKEWLIEKRQQWGNNVTWQLGLIAGIPGQTIEQLEEDNNWLIENDMHCWYFSYLWLEPGYYQSEFSKNSEKYGFTFPDKNIPWKWKNTYWDLDKAIEISTKLNNDAFDHLKIGAWQLGEISSLGYDFSKLMSIYQKDKPKDDIRSKAKEFIKTYIAKSLN